MDRTNMIIRGTLAARPAPGVVNRLYMTTDSGAQRVYQDTGSAWELRGVVEWADLANKPTSFAPSAHKTNHEPGGSDPLTVDAAASTGSPRTLGTGATQAAQGNHSHAHTALTGVDTDTATTAIHHTLGTGANQAAQGSAVPPNTRSINTTAPLTGGGDLSADRTLNINAATTSAAGAMSAADKTKLNNISVSVFKPTAYVAETVARANFATATSALTSGTLHLDAAYLVAGMVISTITFAASGALATGSNQWFSLWDGSRNFLRATSDDGATAWGASTTKTLTLTSSYTVPADGLYYVGVLVVATTPPTLRGMGMDNVIGALTPRLAGTSNTALTNPASAPATANTPIPNSFWAWAGLG